MATNKKEKVEVSAVKLVSIITAPAGMLAHFKGVNAEEQPVEAARQLVAIGLDEEGGLHAITLDDLSVAAEGKPLHGNDTMSLAHITL